MAEPATRVALLARPGAACENLQAALLQAGADVVLVQDPTSGDPDALAASDAGAVLVALEPVVEDVIGRYDAVLADPRRLVIYDEVALAARREGWDAARWSRHLAAKLGGHGDVLPPGAGRDDAPVVSPAAPQRRVDDEARDEPAAQAVGSIDFGGFTPETMAAMALEPVAELPPDPAPAEFEPAPGAEPAHEAGLALEPEPEPAMSLSADALPEEDASAYVMEWDAAPAAPAPEVPAPMPAAPQPQPPPPADAPASFSFSADEMSLVDFDAPAPGTASRPEPLANGNTSPGSQGAVVVLAGIGGPDAVRQFLAALPDSFARPIIVRQRLDGGRHDRLVRQMQRATALPVELAEAGKMLVAGHVYILPDGMTTTGASGTTAFAATDAPVPVLAGLPAAGSAVLVLSGSDPAMVPEAVQAGLDGALVAGQAPEDSFDGAAAAALVAAGGQSRAAAELARLF